MATITKNRSVSDFLLQHDSTDYVNESAIITNPVGAATIVDADLTGLPVVITPGSGVASLVEVGLTSFDEAQANGIIVSNVRVSSLAATESTSGKFAIMLRGPATLVKQGLPTLDAAGNTFTNDRDDIIARYLLLDPPIVTLDITNLTEEQVT